MAGGLLSENRHTRIREVEVVRSGFDRKHVNKEGRRFSRATLESFIQYCQFTACYCCICNKASTTILVSGVDMSEETSEF